MQNEKPVFYLLLSQRSIHDSVPHLRKIIKIKSAATTPLLWEECFPDESEIIPGMPSTAVRNLMVCLCLN